MISQRYDYAAVLVTVVLLVTAALSPNAACDDNSWTNDVDLAMGKAKADTKDLLLVFTAPEWSPGCKRQHEEVFSKSAFQQAASAHFILVKLEFAAAEMRRLPEAKKKWMDRFRIVAFPTVYLADPEGRPYAKTAGYQAGGPEAYLAQLEPLRQLRVKRDEAFAVSQQAASFDPDRDWNGALSRLQNNLLKARYASFDPSKADLLKWLADLQEATEQFEEAIKTTEELLELRRRLLQPNDSKLTDAELDLGRLRRLAELTPAERKHYARAKQLTRDAFSYEAVIVNRQLSSIGDHYQRALEIHKQIFGLESIPCADDLQRLGLSHTWSNDPQGAVRYLEESLRIRTHLQGPHHPSRLSALKYVAEAYRRTGDLEKSADRYRELLDIRKAALGTKHKDYLSAAQDAVETFEQVARSRVQEGDFATAEKLYQEVLAVRTDMNGPDAWQTIDAARALKHVTTLANLPPDGLALLKNADTWHSQAVEASRAGRMLEAIDFETNALQTVKEVLGGSNTSYADRAHFLGNLYRQAGNHERAERLLREALAIRQQLFVKGHPAQAHSMNVLAIVLERKEELSEARTHYETALGVFERTLGKENPDTRTCADNLVGLLKRVAEKQWSDDNISELIPTRQKVVAVLIKMYGVQHWKTQEAASDTQYAICVAKLTVEARRRLREAEALVKSGTAQSHESQEEDAIAALEIALAIYEEIFGRNSLPYARGTARLGELCEARGDLERALESYQLAAKIQKDLHREQFPEYAGLLNAVGLVFYQLKDYSAAEPVLRQAMELRRELLGRNHADYAVSLNNLGWCLLMMGRSTEAKPLWRDAALVYRRVYGAGDPRFLQQVSYLGDLLDLFIEGNVPFDPAEIVALAQDLIQFYETETGLARGPLDSFHRELVRRAQYVSKLAQLEPALRQQVLKAERDLKRSGELRSAGRHKEAVILASGAVDALARTIGNEHYEYAVALHRLGSAYQSGGEFELAEAAYRQALAVLRNLPNGRDWSFVQIANELVTVVLLRYRLDAAEKHLDEAEKILRELVEEKSYDIHAPPDDLAESVRTLSELLGKLARQREDRNDLDAALRLTQEEASLKTDIFGDEHWKTRETRFEAKRLEQLVRLTAEQRAKLAAATAELSRLKQSKQQRTAEKITALKEIAVVYETLSATASWDYLDVFDDLGSTSSIAGDYQSALEYSDQYLALIERSLGRLHPRYAVTRFAQAFAFNQIGQRPRAIEALREAAIVYRDTYGDKHFDYINVCFYLVEALTEDGRRHLQNNEFDAARKQLREALALGAEVFGEDYWIVVDARLWLEHADRLEMLSGDARRRLQEAARLVEKGRELELEHKPSEAVVVLRDAQSRLKPFGDATFLHADAALALGAALVDLQQYDEAEPLVQNCTDLVRTTYGTTNMQYVLALLEQKKVAAAKQNHAELARLSTEIASSVTALARRGQLSHWSSIISMLENEAQTLSDLGELDRAISIYEHLLEIAREHHGSRSVQCARRLDKLGELHVLRGDLSLSGQCLQEAVNILEETGNEQLPLRAKVLSSLGLVSSTLGQHSRAREYLSRAVNFIRQSSGEDGVDFAFCLRRLAQEYKDAHRTDEARQMLERVVEILIRHLTENHEEVFITRSFLGDTYLALGDLEKATDAFENVTKYYQQLPPTKKNQLGLAHSLHLRARVYRVQGDYQRAEESIRQSLEIGRALRTNNLLYIPGLAELAQIKLCQGDFASAATNTREILYRSREMLDALSASQSEQQQLAILPKFRNGLDFYLSVASQAGVPPERVYEELLQWKGAVFVQQHQARQMRARPELKTLYARLDEVNRRLSTLTSTERTDDQTQWNEQVQQLVAQKEELEANLAKVSREFARQNRVVRRKPSDLRRVLPDTAALVDVLSFGRRSRPDGERGRLDVEDCLVAFVVRSDQPIIRVDLGTKDAIQSALERWRQTFGTGEQGTRAAIELRRLVWEPIEAHLGAIETVLLSPDGAFASVPLGALPGSEPGRFLIEERAIAIVPVPQLLPELLADDVNVRTERPSLLALGDIDYGATTGVATNQSRTALAWEKSAKFGSLGATATEIQSVRKSFAASHEANEKTTRLLQQHQATEGAFRRFAPQSRYVHIATHGFFAPAPARSLIAPPEEHDEEYTRSNSAVADPGFLSGLALAGANTSPLPDEDDGILTAAEVAVLDLQHVELAVLSACETVLGEVAGGEGLLGLQRGFQIAGARGVVASLWKVDDHATQTLMTEFYRNLWEKKMSKLEALRQAQIVMLQRYDPKQKKLRGFQPKGQDDQQGNSPFYWAAFVLSGDWR